MELDEAVDRFGAAVVRAVGVEVGQERLTPLLEGLAEPLDLRDRAGRERREDLLCDLASLTEVAGLVGRAELLCAAPCELDLDVPLIGAERLVPDFRRSQAHEGLIVGVCAGHRVQGCFGRRIPVGTRP